MNVASSYDEITELNDLNSKENDLENSLHSYMETFNTVHYKIPARKSRCLFCKIPIYELILIYSFCNILYGGYATVNQAFHFLYTVNKSSYQYILFIIQMIISSP